MDSNKPVDPDAERELKDTMDQAVKDVQNENFAEVAGYMKGSYTAFRKQGFSRKNSFTLTAILYQSLLNRV